MDFRRRFLIEIELIGDYLIECFRIELKAQGHVDTEKLDRSFELKILDLAGHVVMEILAEDYGVIVSEGVKSDRVPITFGSKTKVISKYIDGLKKWFERKGLEEKIALKVAFMTARVHKFGKGGRSGMPTQRSFAWSNNGRRLNWIDAVVAEKIPFIERMAESGLGNLFETYFNDMINKTQIQINA